MAYEKNPDELGALWAKEGSKGPYLTGEIGGVKVVCFPNTKGGDKAPAWRVMKSKPREDGAATERTSSPVTSRDIPF